MRVFIGIKASPALQKEVGAWQKQYKDFPVRWLTPENLHMTLVPPWQEHDIETAVRIMEQAVEGKGEFEYTLTSVGLGPKAHDPKIIWARGEVTPEIASLADALRAQFAYAGQRLLPHLTLARFFPSQMRRFPHPLEEQTIEWLEYVDNVCLFQSHGDSEYSVVERIDLQ